jgi:colanic acid/amylovoran biosynthesis glycosyltransferase
MIYRSEARRILATLRRVDAKLIHIYFGHIGVHLLPLLELLATEDGMVEFHPIPAIVSFHGADADVDFDNPVHRAAMRRVFELASTLLVRSESLRLRLIEHGASDSKIALHRTGIPLEQITFRQRCAPIDGAWRFLQACRLIPKKGLTTSLHAFAEFTREWPGASLTIAGEGPQLIELTRLAAELGVSQQVTFTGFLSQSELRRLEHEAHVFLHPSERGRNGDQEGVPNSMLVAMASGLPVAATLHGGIPEAVEDGVTGYLVKEADAAALARALLQIATTPEHLSRMSEAASRKVAAEFDAIRQNKRL